jgi:hypothetical protein
MKRLRLYLIVAGLGGLSLGACRVLERDDPNSGCLGYLCGARLGPTLAKCPPAAGPPKLYNSGSDPKLNVNLVWQGPGCDKPPPDDQPTTNPGTAQGYKQFHVMQTGATLALDCPDGSAAPVAGVELPDAGAGSACTYRVDPSKKVDRTFWVRLPADYNPSHPYRVVYVGQGCGGDMISNTNTLPLYKENEGGTEEAIYVAIDIPKNHPNMECYDNNAGPGSQEWEMFDLMHKVVDSTYCVDDNRVFISGYSSGGWLSNMYGCYFSGIPTNPARRFAPNYRIRGQAAVTGGEPANNPCCSGPVAGMWIHDLNDPSNPYSGSVLGRDRVLAKNGCAGGSSGPTVPWGDTSLLSDVCVQYTACPKEYPVVFCTTQGKGHTDQVTRAVPGFRQFFDLMEPMAVTPPATNPDAQ